MNYSKETEAMIDHLADGYIHLYYSFNEMVAEFTTLLITINGASFFETDSDNKIKMAGEAAMILKKKNKLKQVNIIVEALKDYQSQL